MSLAFGGAFQLTTQQENDDNNVFKRPKLENGQNVVFGQPGGQKRAVLGTITNNVRVQPSRAAKQASLNSFASKNDENALVRTGKSTFAFPVSNQQEFKIHVDSEPKLENAEKPPVNPSLFQHGQPLNPAVASLSRAPLTNVWANNCESIEGSPMAVDMNSSCEDAADIECTPTSKENGVVNIDAGVDDVLDVPEYAEEIYQYMKEAELKNRPKPGYMKKQPDINNSMRAILMDWLVEVAEEYKLLPQTLYLTVNYIDRFLSAMSVLRGKLQLVGTACMLLASKFEEIYPPEVAEFVYITDDTYTAKQVLKMEQLVLKVLSFYLSVPTIVDFVERFLRAARIPTAMAPKVGSLSKYLCELTLQDSDPYLKYLPSTIAASSVVLALHTFGLPAWTPTLAHYSGFQLHDLQACIHDLHRTFCHAPKHPQQAVREKYKTVRFHGVADLTPPESVPMM